MLGVFGASWNYKGCRHLFHPKWMCSGNTLPNQETPYVSVWMHCMIQIHTFQVYQNIYHNAKHIRLVIGHYYWEVDHFNLKTKIVISVYFGILGALHWVQANMPNNKGYFTHEPRAVTMKLWEPKRKCPKAVPMHPQII